MKILLLLLAVLVILKASDICPPDLEKSCVEEVNTGTYATNIAYQSCDEAAKEKGKDTSADIDCLKYFSDMRKGCWPCICQIAKYESWTIKGCTARHH